MNIFRDADGDIDGFLNFFGGSHSATAFKTVKTGEEFVQLMQNSLSR